MDRNTLIKWLITVGLLAGSLALVTPPSKKIRLGLDLKGGTSFVVKIDDEEVRRDILAREPGATEEQVTAMAAETLKGAQERALEVLRNRIDNLGIAEPVIYPSSDNRITIQLPGVDEKKRKEAEDSIRRVAFLEFRMVHENNEALSSALFEKGLAPEGYRIDQVGGQPVYLKNAAFPDVQRDEAWKVRVGRFHTPDAGYELLMEKQEREGRTVYLPRFVKRRRELSGEYLKNAKVDYRQMGQPVVLLEFDAKGAKMFGRVTSAYAPGGSGNPDPNRSRQLAIVLDGTLYSAPAIREAIYGGKAEISGSFSVPEATLLANILRAGSLPAPVRVVEQRFVAPTLGADSIRSGVSATIIGGVAVVVFMSVYYLANGLVANIALLLNLLLLPLGAVITAGVLSVFAKDAAGGGTIQLPVLTLPGIAGIVLTLGMAVDANVLIFERMREEVKTGKSLWGSITAGYDRAFLAILDSNLTTVLSGVILFIFGSGPVRGFAVTLCAGILCSMFTALTVTKLVFGLLANRDKPILKSIRMLSLIGETKIDFIGKQVPAIAVSVIIILGSWTALGVRTAKSPEAVLGVDFRGGSAVTFTVEADKEGVPVEDVRKALQAAGVSDAHIQYQREMEAGGQTFMQVKTALEKVGEKPATDVVKETVASQFPAAGYSAWQEDVVGTLIGKEMIRKAIWAVGLSLVGMIIYLAWRFEFGFGLGAMVALLHDVLITAGVYVLFGRQIGLTIIAALLTIVGFSVNDTIVTFDRIRENLKLNRTGSFKDVCNLSINQTLSRTILTSLTVVLAVLSLLIFGGGAINDFALAMLIGCVFGTYSSVYIATPVVLWWHRNRRPDFGK